MKRGQQIAEALSHVHSLVDSRNGVHVIHTSEINRKERELLLSSGWLQEILKGWYLLVRPDIRPGDSSAWYASFWGFLQVYLGHYYGEEYCLCAEQSLDLHLGSTQVPKQVVIMAQKGRGAPTGLPFDTSLLIYSQGGELPKEREKVAKLQVMTLPFALCKVSPTFFTLQPEAAEIALRSVKNSDELLRVIINNNFSRAANRLVGAYRFLGNEKMVRELIQGLKEAYIPLQETNPFVIETPLLRDAPSRSPYADRILAMWHQYRSDVIKHFPKAPGLPKNAKKYLQKIEDQYIQDAYNSLSIEGYQVNAELISRVRRAEWDPDNNDQDSDETNILAARGYYEAFLALKKSMGKILDGGSPGEVVEADLGSWYRSLLAPCVNAGIIDKGDLYGYRAHQVFIRNSRHTPLPVYALLDAMEVLFLCLKEEPDAGVRGVLGHFFFVYIHPYMDGNGRIGRFLMNAMFGSGGYEWTVVHLTNRKRYLEALEEASVNRNIVPLALFLKSEQSF